MITIKVMTKNQEYCGFQGWQQTEKMMTCQVLSTNIIISYIAWYMNIFWVRYFYLVDKLPWNLKKELNNFQFFFFHEMTRQSLKFQKFMTDQVVNTFGHVWWLSVISTHCYSY